MSDWSRLETSAARAAAGDEDAWSEFMAGLSPKLSHLVRRQRIGRLRAREDDVQNIVVRVFEKLARDERAPLRRYFAMARRPSFPGWLARVVRSSAIDYMRLHPEYRRPRGPGANEVPSDERWVSLETLTTGVGVQGPDSLADKRRQVVRDIRAAHEQAKAGDLEQLARAWKVQVLHMRRLANKGHLYEPVMELLFRGHSQREIASELDISRREVELIQEYVRDFLQARYRQQ